MADDFANAGTWRPLACAGDAPSPRAYHSADACERGIIIFGGDVADLVDDAEARTVFLLDTARHRWERVQAAGEPPAGIIGHATIISDDRVYVFGGLDGGFERRGAEPYSSRLSLLDLRSSPPSWSAVMADEGSAAEQPPPRRDARLVVLPSAQPGSDKRPALFRAPARGAHPSLLLFGGWDLLSCKGDLQKFVSTKRGPTAWIPVVADAGAPPPPSARRGHSATLVSTAFSTSVAGDNAVYVYGGCRGVAKYLDDLHVLDVFGGSMRWTARPDVSGASPGPRAWHSANDVGRGRVVLFGGARGAGADGGVLLSNELHLLDTAKLAWSAVRPAGAPPPPRCAHSATCVGDALLVFGGRGDDGLCADGVWALELDGVLLSENEVSSSTSVKAPSALSSPLEPA